MARVQPAIQPHGVKNKTVWPAPALRNRGSIPGRIEWFIEDQAFLWAPSPFPLSRQTKFFLFLSLPVCRRSSLLSGEGGGGVKVGGLGAKSYITTTKKPCHLKS
jgi:hypothetical protein